MIWPIENLKPLYYLYNSFAPQARAVELEPKFQARASASKNFWIRAMQNCLGSGYTALFLTDVDQNLTCWFQQILKILRKGMPEHRRH